MSMKKLAVLSAVLVLAVPVWAAESLLKDLKIEPKVNIRFQSGNPSLVYDEANDAYENRGQRTAVGALFDITFTKEFESGAVVLLNLQGNGNTQEGAKSNGVPISAWSGLNSGFWSADDGVNVSDLNISQPFLDNKISVIVGKFGTDTYLSANEAGEFFETNLFNPDPIFIGVGGDLYGLAVQFSPTEYIDIFASYQANDIDNIGWDYAAAELTFKLPIKGNEGNYRIGYWQNNESGQTLIDDDAKKAAASGFMLSIDQKIVDGVLLFGRYGAPITQTQLNTLNAFGLGFILEGSLWKRADDSVGIGFGIVSLAGKAADEKFGGNKDKNYQSETHFELYYNYKASDAISLSPAIQYIQNPQGGGIEDSTMLGSYVDSILIYGIRIMLGF
ncbi:MAG: carbohydrate porin [Elusimicrobiota bacterium]|jgi:carbohydrate-selective porin OprB|nr:carbohydrate porin [Elusimicrobiota bacterium]